MEEEKTYHDPPAYLMRFLRWFCATSFLEEIEGDLYELYQEEVEAHGLPKAKRRFLGTSIRYIRPYFFGKKDYSINLQYHLAMLQHYLKVSLRHLWKQRLYSIINICGLALGLACFIVVLFYVKEELGYDNYHNDSENLYRLSINSTIMSSGDNQDNASSPILWGPALKRDLPEVEEYARFVRLVNADNPWKLNVGENTFSETDILYADTSTFELFNWPFVHGDPGTALNKLNSIVLTETMAKKYFGSENPIGKTIKLDPRLRDEDGSFRTTTYDYFVTGVIKDIPKRSHFTFDFLLPIQHLNNIFGLDVYGNGEDNRWFWRGTIGYTYLRLTDGTNPASLDEKFADFQDRYLGEDTRSRGYFYTPFLQKIDKIYLEGNIGSQLQPVGDKTYVYGFSLVALFVLFIACINFMNLSTARAATRAKEVGLRKVIGARLKQLVNQFLGESVVITLIALCLALGLALYMLPIFYGYLDKDFVISYTQEFPFLLGLIGVGALVGIIAGVYPAFFLSKYKPVKVLKGSFFQSKSGDRVRKALVVFQFFISVFLIIITLTLHKQLDYMKSYELGFDQDRVLVVPPNTARSFANQYEAIKAELLKSGEVADVTMSSGVPGQGFGGDIYALKEAPVESGFPLNEYFTDYNFIDMFGLSLIAGRNFSKDISTDAGVFEEGRSGEVKAILNESAVRKFGFASAEEALGKQIVRDPNAKDWIATVIGVVKDFHIESLREEVSPVALILNSRYRFLSVKLNGANLAKGIAVVEAKAKEFAPDATFEYNFLDETFREQYESEQLLGEVFTIISFIAIFIACLGLFGLAAFTTAQRIKEISIRKTLGATVSDVVMLLSKDFIKLVFISVIVAIPLAWYLTEKGLANFAYRINGMLDIFVWSLLIAMCFAFFTVSFHTIKAALANPADMLKAD